jgi:SHS2 domain-containing protein
MRGRPAYREIEHTADVGFELVATSRREAFEAAGLALFDLMVDVTTVGASWSGSASADGVPGDDENLMVRWLSELIFLRESEGILVRGIDVVRFDGSRVEAKLEGERFDPARHAVRTDIKAATYHDLVVRAGEEGFHVRVIFDT